MYVIAVFGIANLTYISLEIDVLFSSEECGDPATYGWTFILHLIFVIMQTFFLFKVSEVNNRNMLPAHFLVHVIYKMFTAV